MSVLNPVLNKGCWENQEDFCIDGRPRWSHFTPSWYPVTSALLWTGAFNFSPLLPLRLAFDKHLGSTYLVLGTVADDDAILKT